MKKGIFLGIFLFLLFPVFGYAQELIPNGESGILIEAGSGKILYAKEKDKRRSVASMTKMVAQIIILEEIENKKIHLDDIVTVSRNASGMGGSQIYLEEGEKISVRDLMKGVSVASGNDATVALAEYISGSEEAFVQRMNQVVKDLGLQNTHFMNCTGLDQEDHYSSSYDMAMIARELVLNHPMIFEFSSIYEDYLRENTEHKFWLVNTNKLIRFYEGADGLKTGHTDDAGYCLAATAKRGDLRLIGIVLGEEDSKVRNQEMMDFLDYGFQSVQMNCLLNKDSLVDSISLELANPKKIPIVLKDNLCVVEEKGKKEKYEYQVHLSPIELPLHNGDVLGRIDVVVQNQVVASGVLTTNQTIEKVSLFRFYLQNIMNLILGVF